MAGPRKIRLIDDLENGWNVDFPDEKTWAALKNHLPVTLSEEDDARLHEAIKTCVDHLAGLRAAIDHGASFAVWTRSPRKDQLSPLDKLVKHLTAARDVWKEMSGVDEASEASETGAVRIPFDGLEEMTRFADSLRKGALGLKEQEVTSPWAFFVRGISEALRSVGLKPGVTGRGYDDDNASTWFQDFMAALNSALPIRLREPVHGDKAFDAKVARAMRGDKKPG